jgi:hypothetical protein
MPRLSHSQVADSDRRVLHRVAESQEGAYGPRSMEMVEFDVCDAGICVITVLCDESMKRYKSFFGYSCS